MPNSSHVANGPARFSSLGHAPLRGSPTSREPPVHVASLAEKKRLWWTNAFINGLFIAGWFFFATLLSVYNKWMFSPDRYGFPSPLFVTTAHMWVQFALASLLRYTLPRHFRPEQIPTREDYIRKVVPTGITTGLDIGLSNLSLKLITLSFYTMGKSSSLVFVLLFAFLLRLEKFSWRLIGVIFLICAGVLLMVATQTNFVLGGFLLVIFASALGGLRWSLTQLLLRSKNIGMNNPAATLFWLTPIMGLTLAISSAVSGDWGKVSGSDFFATPGKAFETAFFLTCPGVLAFCMVLSEFYIIQRAGVVPMSIAGIAKEVTTIICAAWFFGDELTPLNITGVAITACGIGLYTYHKYQNLMHSDVALDPHGNPLSEEEGVILDGDVALESGDLAERERLTSNIDDEDVNDEDERQNRVVNAAHDANEQLLFAVEDEEDEDEDIPSKHRQRLDSVPPPYPGNESDVLHDVWRGHEDIHTS
ncbi:TPT-domain-containing protein [Dichomitus squalens LYAD-421 SS1]|uniref:TPT-domain-containing protein n=1 Tax=Dichomitus squalens (strain LYAD-421) TaxID=732165 RepID=R7SN65_DICSQ|nr:TPT-domain-containing protein [Dichomitus squalens LYAD-421 SS1]EJF57629.1 TPT-domain-containing protein [Dichomitus squalens LYAD-421 SS1]